MFTTLIEDVTGVLRRWRRRPAVPVVSVMALGLGIAAATTTYSIVNAAARVEPRWPNSDRLVLIRAVEPERRQNAAFMSTWDRAPISWQSWEDLQHTAAFDKVGVWIREEQRLEGHTEPLQVLFASTSFLELLGAAPASGRLFTETEDQEISESVIVSHEAWQENFGGAPDLVGSQVRLFHTTATRPVVRTVVGILAPGFEFEGERPAFILPVGYHAYNGSFGHRFLNAIGLLAEGVTIDSALVAAEPLIRRDEPVERRTARLVMLADERAARYRVPWLMSAASVLLLLLGCSTVAGLLLAEGHHRFGEVALREALGASRGAVCRHHVVEYTLLSLVVTSCGLGLSRLLLPVLLGLTPVQVPGLSVALDGQSLTLALSAAATTIVVFGCGPVLVSSAPSARMLAGATTLTSRTGHLQSLVIVQIAIVLVLLVGAGLLGDTLRRLWNTPLGFEPSGLTTATVAPDLRREVGAPEAQSRTAYLSQLGSAWQQTAHTLSELRAITGVASAAAARATPFSDVPLHAVRVGSLDGRASDRIEVLQNVVTERYFEVMGIPVLRGRTFRPEDRSGPPVLIISEALERRLADGERQLDFISGENTYRVIGVVGDVRHRSFGAEDHAMVYSFHRTPFRTSQFVVRNTGRGPALPLFLRAAIERVDEALVVRTVTDVETRVADALATERFLAAFAGILGVVGSTVATLGLFGFLARLVAARSREIGIRIAVGASPGRIRRMVVGDGARAMVVGILVGLPAVFAAAKVLTGSVSNVQPLAPAGPAVAVAALAVVVVAAAWLPARRAAAVDPQKVLRD